jgi:hypothetical protein
MLEGMGRGRLLALAVVAGAGLLAIYLYANAVLQGSGDLRAFSSGIFDMDVSRVVVDLTSDRPAYRASVHPLQKLLIAPFGGALAGGLFGERDPLAAARLLVALCMTLQTLAVGALAWQLARHSVSAAVAALCLCGTSFSTWLAASIPESAAVASLASVLPLLFLNARWGRRFGSTEALAWALLGVLAFGLTVTQLAHCAIALGVRAVWGRERVNADGAAAALWPKLILVGVLFAALFVGGLRLQASLYPSAPKSEDSNPLAVELHFLRTDRFAARPFAHAATVLGHFFVIDFVAPSPGYSDFLIRDYDLQYWSLSLEEAGLAQWTTARAALAVVVLAGVSLAGAGLRRADVRLLAPAACVASQLALHVVYGREYVLYSPHWHGVLVALLVAAAWRAHPRRHTAMVAAAAALSLLLFANDVTVMRDVYRELDLGLGVDVRDVDGAPLGAR